MPARGSSRGDACLHGSRAPHLPQRSHPVRIHPLALVHPTAQIGQDVVVGPFSIVEAGVVLGDRCVLASHVVIKTGTTMGPDNHVYEGAVIGGLPQHVKMPERPGTLAIGRGNTFRENTTIHRALAEDHTTTLGDSNLMMVATHVAHDCHVGNNTIFANGAMIAGHVLVEDRAYISGAVAVHQFCRIGRMAMVGGHARVSKDIPPFTMIDGTTGLVVGLNTIGLRRNGFSGAEITQVKAAYRLIFRSGLKWREILDRLHGEFTSGLAAHFYEFMADSHRGITQERRLPPGATIRLRDADDEMDVQELPRRAKAG